jgi:hypothetical protein
MDDSGQTLVVFLSMHRCGSSVTASTLHSLGMSLGPFELNEALPSNPHGHFEAVPFLQLNRRIQERALGFPDDIPQSPEVLSQFWNSQGVWSEGTQIPDEMLDEGRVLLRALIDSGPVSGFKDPRTVLTWPFWVRVFKDFPGLRIVPVSLLRSPHEIAMSLVTRRNGWCGYWNSLDVVAVHLRRQMAILSSWGKSTPGLCFGSPSFVESLAEAARQCGLSWDKEKALEVFDQSCVHQSPAAVDHEAQDIFDALCNQPAPLRDAEKNRRQLAKDARFLEALRIQQWHSINAQLADAQAEARRPHTLADEIRRQLQETEASLDGCRTQLHAAQQELLAAQQELLAAQQELLANHRTCNAVQESLIQAQDRVIRVRDDNEALRGRVTRFESHPFLSTALRVRRGMRRIIHTAAASAAHGPGESVR